MEKVSRSLLPDNDAHNEAYAALSNKDNKQLKDRWRNLDNKRLQWIEQYEPPQDQREMSDFIETEVYKKWMKKFDEE